MPKCALVTGRVRFFGVKVISGIPSPDRETQCVNSQIKQAQRSPILHEITSLNFESDTTKTNWLVKLFDIRTTSIRSLKYLVTQIPNLLDSQSLVISRDLQISNLKHFGGKEGFQKNYCTADWEGFEIG